MRSSKEIEKEIQKRFPAKDQYGKTIIYAHYDLSKLLRELANARFVEGKK